MPAGIDLFHGKPSQTMSRMSEKVDLSTWLTKQQAAETIGVSTKTVERFAQERQLQQARWRRPGGGAPVVVFHPDDVARLAQARQPEAEPFVVPSGQDREAPAGDDATAIALPPVPSPDVWQQLVAVALRVLAHDVSETRLRHLSQTSETLFLTLREASAYSGLSVGRLRALIRDGHLVAMRDRGWKIRRRDLEAL